MQTEDKVDASAMANSYPYGHGGTICTVVKMFHALVSLINSVLLNAHSLYTPIFCVPTLSKDEGRDAMPQNRLANPSTAQPVRLPANDENENEDPL